MARKMVYSVRYDNGWIEINGVIGRRYYLWYSQREAKARYCAECRREGFK